MPVDEGQCGYGTTICGKKARYSALVWARTKSGGDELVAALVRLCGVHHRAVGN